MIRLSNQVPSVYSNASRDFQYLGRLIDIVLNSVKHNVDDLYDLPNNEADIKLTELLAMTLGFKIKRNYDQKQLKALVAALPRILKYKGTMTAVEMAGNALIASSGASGDFDSEVKNGELFVAFPATLVDISLFSDLLDYILPAGMTCHIARKNLVTRTHVTEYRFDEDLRAELVPDFAAESRSLAEIFDVDQVAPTDVTFASFMADDTALIPNVGLLDNGVIPLLDSSIRVEGPLDADITLKS